MIAAGDQNITALATARWAAATDAQLSTTMHALTRHLHAFVGEVALTEREWAAAMAWLTRAGQISDEKRAEFVLASDVLGLSMLVVELNRCQVPGVTPATVLGPFYIGDSPPMDHGADMASGLPGIPLYITGTVRDIDGGTVTDAVLDVWQADSHGLYEAQVDTREPRLRGKYTVRPDGSFCVRTVAPLGYSIPMDGPVGELISRAGIPHERPAHIHFLISAPGYEPLVTHLFEKGAPYLDSDVVFATTPALVVPFDPQTPGPTPAGDDCAAPWLLATYDFVLARAAETSTTTTQEGS